MIFFFVPVALVLAITMWIAFVPVYLRVNTAQHRYNISQYGIIRVSFHPGEDPFVQLRVFGIMVNVSGKQKQEPKSEKVRKSKERKRKSLDAWLLLARGMVKSIRCKKLQCTFDTCDVLLNAQLVPLMLLANRNSVHMSVNFREQYFLELILEARIYKMIWAFIQFLTKK